MVEKRLVDYIKKYKSLGYSREDISNKLVKDSWKEGDVKEAFSIAEKETAISVKNKKKHLIIIISVILIIIIVSGIFLFENKELQPKIKKVVSKAILSCLNNYGFICNKEESCPGTWLKATDTGRCCSVMCK